MIELTLAEIARPMADDCRERIALVSGEQRTTYAELDEHANQVANGLMALGCVDQERIAILDHNSDHFYELWLGAARANLVATPLNARFSAREVAQVLADCRPRVLFVGEEFVALIDQVRPALGFVERVVVLGEDYLAWRDAQPASSGLATMDLDDACLQIYTSGTTGVPKGVQLTSRSILSASLCAPVTGELSPCNPIDAHSVVLLCLPHAHVAGSLLGIFGLARGARLVIARHFVPEQMLDIIEREQVTLTLMVPVMVRGLMEAMARTGRACTSLKTIIYGAAPMAASLLQEAMQALPHSGFGQIYGLTETSGPIAYLTPADHQRIAMGDSALALSCGRATAGVELQVIDVCGHVLPAGDVGEIICRSSQVMPGYWQRHEETQEVIREGWFHTGDMGYLDAQGYLYIYDRKRDMIISGGENVYPAEVENVLYSHPAVLDVAVIGVPDEQWGEAVKAVAILKPGASLSEEELIAHARGKVAGFKLPKTVEFVAELPRNATGKVLRRLIREPYWRNQGRGVA